MIAIGLLLVRMLCDFFKPRPWLEVEILILRHQLNVLQRRAPRRRLHLRWVDRALFIWLYRHYPRILAGMSIVRPETVVRWHRKGLAHYWRWRSRSPGGRPRIAQEVRELIRRMSFENPLWGATKIHGELLKLGIAVAQSTVSIYMVPRRDRPLQTWMTFLRNHMEGIASTATACAAGAIEMPGSKVSRPVRLPPRHARLATKPKPIGSATSTNTVGITRADLHRDLIA